MATSEAKHSDADEIEVKRGLAASGARRGRVHHQPGGLELGALHGF